MSLLSDISHLLFPRYCPVCNSKLAPAEQYVCTTCLSMLPRTGFGEPTNNALAQRFYEWESFVKGVGWLYYQHGNAYSQLIRQAKYDDLPATARYLARYAATEMATTEACSDFFSDIDCLVPVPLSRQRERQRGYNQSLFIAQGLADITGIAITRGCLLRTIHNKTQTRLGREERRKNVEGIFSVRHPERLQGKHVLLIDDVMTTGATLASCIRTLQDVVPDIRVSVFVLACARRP